MGITTRDCQDVLTHFPFLEHYSFPILDPDLATMRPLSVHSSLKSVVLSCAWIMASSLQDLLCALPRSLPHLRRLRLEDARLAVDLTPVAWMKELRELEIVSRTLRLYTGTCATGGCVVLDMMCWKVHR